MLTIGRNICRTSLSLLGGVALAVPAALAVGAPAQAASVPWDCSLQGDSYVEACFSVVQNAFYVRDAESDGASAVVIWSSSDGRSGSCRNSSGYGTVKRCSAGVAGGATVYWDNYTYDGSNGDWDYTSGTYSAKNGGIA